MVLDAWLKQNYPSIWNEYHQGHKPAYLTQAERTMMGCLETGEVVERAAVYRAVWGSQYLEAIDFQRLNKLVSRLREKIGADRIETVKGVGYRLVK